jgi:hypothetical protein
MVKVSDATNSLPTYVHQQLTTARTYVTLCAHVIIIVRVPGIVDIALHEGLKNSKQFHYTAEKTASKEN